MTVKATGCTKCKRTLAKIFSVSICEVFGLFWGFGWGFFFGVLLFLFSACNPSSFGGGKEVQFASLLEGSTTETPVTVQVSATLFTVQLSTSHGGTLIFLSLSRQMQYNHKKQYKLDALVISLPSFHPIWTGKAALRPAYPTLSSSQCLALN